MNIILTTRRKGVKGEIMTTKEGLRFKRNTGLDRYTKEWKSINLFLDRLKKTDYLTIIGSEEAINLILIANQIEHMYSWKILPYDTKRKHLKEAVGSINLTLKRILWSILLYDEEYMMT
jgi:hypothetical protein